MSSESGRSSRELAYTKMVDHRHNTSGLHMMMSRTATDLALDNPGKFSDIQEAYESVARGLWHHSAVTYSGTEVHDEVKQAILSLIPHLI